MSFINVIRKRLVFLLLVVLGVSVITFAISHLIPGDPARLVAGERASEEVVNSIRVQMGLDRPLPEQYWKYLIGTAQGDLGTSLKISTFSFRPLSSWPWSHCCWPCLWARRWAFCPPSTGIGR
jgi:peptide/nickel transport system permease protein